MALPATISVKYTEEEAGYLSVRPMVRQTFRLEELLDMVLGVTGKNAERVQQILRSGTVVYHSYRYWWSGFDADPDELAALLERFPGADPARPFHGKECTAILLEGSGQPPRFSLKLDRVVASRRHLFRTHSLWQSLMSLAEAEPPAYRDYSYPERADRYARELSPRESEELAGEVLRLAPRLMRAQLDRLPAATRLVFLCPRKV